MDKITVPFKLESRAVSYQGEWTAEEIDAGLADAAHSETVTDAKWYQPTADGPVEITDPARIAELESKISAQ